LYYIPYFWLGYFVVIGGERSLKLINKSIDIVVSEDVIKADSFIKRLKGLMFTKKLSSQSALYIYPCSGIHTYFMNYNIDVLYLDINNTILAIDEDMQPGKFGKYIKDSVAVIELPKGKAKETSTKIGQVVELV
jgi:uncharacterized membrane protein (UPF0127 family)